MVEVRVSSKNQIVVPREIRDSLQIKARDRILIVPMQDQAAIIPRPDSHRMATAGITADLYPVDYLREEHRRWNKRK